MSFGLSQLMKCIKSNEMLLGIGRSFLIFYIISEVFLSYLFMFFYPNHEGKSYYKTWANYLQEQEDIYNEDTLIICTYGKTWIYYYFSYVGKNLPNNVICVDPLEFPNSQDMSKENLSQFRYIVKNGQKVLEKITKNDLEKYNVIYYLEEYRTISKEFKDYFEKYSVTKMEESNIIKLEKIDEK